MKKNAYIIGIDGGSQSSKVVIFDLEGNVIASGSEKLKPLYSPEPGVAEHPDDDLWNSLIIASRRAMENFTGKREDIIGIGLCTIRCCRALLKEDGSLASPVLSWMDMRLSRPYEHLDEDVRWVTTSSGYISNRFTGEFKDTASNYEGEWPMDKKNWRWSEDPEVLKHYNIPREMLFEVVNPGEILGYVTHQAALETGIPEGLPVAATANDKAVEALGAGLQEGRHVLVSLGTYIGSMMYGDEYIENAQKFFSNMASVPNRYLYESGGIRRGMWTISWFESLLGDDLSLRADRQGLAPVQLLDKEAEEVPPGSEGLMTVLDWLPPPDRPYKKGLMIGFDGRHTSAHMYRSILEAIALTMKNHAYAMADELGKDIEGVVVSGGGSNSDLFMQIFADVFEVPASRSLVNEAAGIGSAICAAAALGVYEDFDTAAEHMVKNGESFPPIEKNRKLYRQMNDEVFKQITNFTDEVLKKSYPIFG